jgi:hypothetical protein
MLPYADLRSASYPGTATARLSGAPWFRMQIYFMDEPFRVSTPQQRAIVALQELRAAGKTVWWCITICKPCQYFDWVTLLNSAALRVGRWLKFYRQ